MAKKCNVCGGNTEIVDKKPLYVNRKTKGGKNMHFGTQVTNVNGKSTTLLTPAGKGAKAATELKMNARITNDGEVKTNKNGTPQKLSKAQRAWRSGYLAAQKDSANCYNAKQKKGVTVYTGGK